MRKILVFLALVSCLALNGPLFAQATSGSVSGHVEDDSGAMLPGVTVELSGPAMQGTKTTVTDGEGHYTFRNIPPGEGYDVTATLSSFATVTKQNFRVSLGQDAQINMTLKAAVSESITVTAESPLVDTTKTTTGVNVTSQQFESLPTARTFQQLTAMAPGVSMEMGDSRSNQLGNSPNVGAASAPENNYIIDGLSTTDARYGTSGTNLTMNFVEEVQVMTGGYPAEYGRATGGVFNVITKSGGNELHGDVFGYLSDAGWTTERVNRRAKGGSTDADVTDSQDYGLSLGGPIMKDRLWFFGAFNPSRRTIDVGETTRAGGVLIGDAATEYDQETDFYAGKLTFALNPNHNLVLTAFGDPTSLEGWLIRGIGAVPADTGAALRKTDIGSNNLNFRYTGVLTPSWLLEANIGRHEKDNTLGPASEIGATVPRQIDETIGGGWQRGGFMRTQNDESTRDAYAIKMSNFVGAHEFRYGIDIENNVYNADTHEVWYRYFGDYSDSTDYIQERDYSVAGEGKTANRAAFLQDSWKLLPNLQLNLGVRYEEQELDSANDVTVSHEFDADGFPIYEKVDSLQLDGNWAPRLGLVWDPANTGRTKVYAFAGRFFEAIPLDLNIRAINGERYVVRYWESDTDLNSDTWVNPTGSPIGAGFTRWRNDRVLGTTTAIDADLKAQYQDEVILGGEYQFASAWSGGIRLVNRELKRVIEDFGVFGDPNDPSALTDYVIGNPGEGLFGAPYDKPERKYQAAELTLQRAMTDNWQLYASYTYAKAEGNYEGLFMSGYEQLDPNITALYDIPSFLQNASGKLRADRPYLFKVHASYKLPFGLTVSEAFQYSAGIPISAQGPELTNGYGDGTIFLKPRGSEGRTPDFWNLDLHADYTLPFFNASSRGLSLIVDIFNVFDNDETLEVDQDYIYEAARDLGGAYEGWFEDENLDSFGNPQFNPNLPASPFYKSAILIQSPRSVQVGVKFTY